MRRPALPRAVSTAVPGMLALATAVGLAVGAVVALFDELVLRTADVVVTDRPVWLLAAAPGAGLVLTAAILRWVADGASSATSDEYIRVFHDRGARLELRPLPGRLLAGITTMGFGGALGLEGPAAYTGATLGDVTQHRFHTVFRREDAKVLLTAGAAAGVSAIFKTPATGVVFALEAPYLDDIAPRALLPSLLASASSYLVFVTLEGTDPVIPPLGTAPNLRPTELLGAVLVGLLAGLAGRAFAWAVHRAKELTAAVGILWRIAAASVILAGLLLVAEAAFEAPLTLGPGYGAVEWAQDPSHGLGLVAALFGLRVAATVATAAGGGTGGLFIPLAVQGILLGRFVGGVLDQPAAGLYPTIGLAAFLGAGYRVPLSAVMFVAETSGQATYVIPALIAAAVSQLVVGRASVALHQRTVRQGHLESRLTLPLATALSTDVLTVPPDATIDEFVAYHVLGQREPVVAVVEGGRYRGMCFLEDAVTVERERWAVTPVREVMRTEVPCPGPGSSLRGAVAAMDRHDLDLLPVVDDEGGFVGLVRWSEIVKLDDVLERTERPAGDPPTGEHRAIDPDAIDPDASGGD